MLSKDEEEAVEDLLAEFARRGQVRAAETATLLARVPARPEVLEHFVSLAKLRELYWVEHLARTMVPLQSGTSPEVPKPPPVPTGSLTGLLRTRGPYPRKVDALLAALRGRDPELARAVRASMASESDPFVLATMASVLGQIGSAADAPLLLPLLRESDGRVVANALEAIRRLGIEVPLELIGQLVQSPENRVRTNAIALMAAQDPAQALDLLTGLARSDQTMQRSSVAYLLGELVDQPKAVSLLVEMLTRETQTAVLKQLAQSLRKHATVENAAALVGPLYRERQAAQGARRSVLETVLHEIAVECGLVESEVEALGKQYLDEEDNQAAEPAPLAAVSASLPEELREADEEVSFGSVWGTPRPPVASASPSAAGDSSGRTPVTRTPSGQIPAPVSPPAGLGAKPIWAAAGLLVVALVLVRPWSNRRAEPPPTAAGSPGGKRTKLPPKSRVADVPLKAWQPGKEDPELKALESFLGPGGAPVDIKGKVMGSTFGRTVVRCQGRTYVVVRGVDPARAERGSSVHVVGRLLGSTVEGIFYVEGGLK